MEQYLIFEDDTSKKFWHIRVDGLKTIVTFGRIGTAGQTQEKAFPTAADAEKEAAKQAASKLKKGYVASTPPAPVEVTAAPVDTAAPKTAPANKPAAAKTENGPADVADDGQPKPWHGEEYYEYPWYYPGEESIFLHLEAARDEPYDEEDGAQPPKAVKAAGTANTGDEDIEFDEDDDEHDRERKREQAHLARITPAQLVEEYREQARTNHRFGQEMTPEKVDAQVIHRLCYVISDKADSNYSYRDCEKHMEALRLMISDDAEYEQELGHALFSGIKDITRGYLVNENDVERLQWLLEHGATFRPAQKPAATTDDGVDIEDDDYKADVRTEIMRRFIAAYEQDPVPSRAAALFGEVAAQLVSDLAPQYAAAFRDTVHAFVAGEINGGVWHEGSTYWALQPDGVEPSKWPDRYFRKFEREDGTGLQSDTTRRELRKYLPPLLQTMAQAGEFDGLKDKGFFVLVVKDRRDSASYLRHVLDQTLLEAHAAALETLIADMETAPNFEVMDGFIHAVEGLLDGVYLPADMPRARALIRQYLYSGYSDAQEQAVKFLDRYDVFFPEIKYDRAVWLHLDGSFGPDISVMEDAAKAGYAPAAEKLSEFVNDAIRRKEMAERYKAGGGAAADSGKRLKVGRDNFHAVFSESDLLLSTDRVTVRAYADSHIYIRFKIEGEQAYAEVLDWLCALLEKDYVDLNNGYQIRVRFLIKPVFIKELGDFPQNTCHAFFARAVQYPALREKVKRYAELALHLFDWYRDLEDEDNCVTGTFAACALAFADEQYVPLIGLFGRNSDDEHQDIQLQVAGPLFKKYGATPAVAAALYDIQSSNGQEGDISLNKALLTTPECLTAVMEHIAAGELGAWAPHHLEYHVPGYVEAIWGDNTKSNLKKFKQFADGAATPEDKNAFVDFYNFYKGYASLRDKEDYGDDLDSAAEGKKDIVVPVYDTDPLLPRKDAEKAGWHFDEEGIDDRRAVLFCPAAVDDPELLDYVLDQYKAGCDAYRSGVRMTFSWHNHEEIARREADVFGNWVFYPGQLAHDWGVLLTDGKRKPFVLYGIMNTVAIAARWCKRPFKTPEEAEAMRQSSLQRESPKALVPETDEQRALEALLDRMFDAVFNGNWWTAGHLAPSFAPEHGRFYDASLLLRLKTAIHMEELDEAAALCDEFAARRPEFAPAIARKRAELGRKPAK